MQELQGSDSIVLSTPKKYNKYYQPKGFSLEIFKKRYAASAEETWFQACERVAATVSKAEGTHGWYDKFYEMLAKNLFMPGGRIWYGAGRPRGQLLNCFVLGAEDSREGWGKTVSDSIVVSGTGGGIGINFSPVRPRGQEIKGAGGVTTGAVSLMEIINSAGNVIKAGGGRRTAYMFALSLSHGDIVEFLDKKLNLKELNNANISVIFDENPEVFFEHVREDKPWKLWFNQKEVGEIPARVLFDKIIDNQLIGGEPGGLNLYLANKMSNISMKLTCCNPCGEIVMPPNDCCCLGSLVLPRFQNVRGELDWQALRDTISTGVRFLDDVLDVNNYPLEEIRETCQRLRRIGLGVMGLHDMLLNVGLRYSSDEGKQYVNKVMNYIKECAYDASIELAREKGSFPEWKNSTKKGFIKTLDPYFQRRIDQYGLRNCALLTIPPTGTTAIVCGVTSGIEPMFAPGYRRKYYEGDALREEIVIHPLFQKFVLEGNDVSHFQGAYDLSLRDHLEMQRICQKHVCNSVSKTLNLRPGVSKKEYADLYMEYLPKLKGLTVYPEGSRADQPLTPLTIEEAMIHVGNAQIGVSEDSACKTGQCDV